jgi:hypothetical protein
MTFGKIVLFGSGETSPTGGRVFEGLAKGYSRNICISILETPAGFEPNSEQVAKRIAVFLNARLADKKPQIYVVPARRKGTAFSPDDPALLEPLLAADWIFLGPGSPTYAVRQLKDSLAWQYVLAGWQQGASLVMASAAVIASGAFVLPVYEIFKAGEDTEWKPGLDLLGPLGLKVAIIPHWNNTEGGEELDTSHAFIGRARFDALRVALPADVCVLGIDEYTALSLDLNAGIIRVEGVGAATVSFKGEERQWKTGVEFPLAALGDFKVPAAPFGVDPQIWEGVRKRRAVTAPESEPPPEVAELYREREKARQAKDYARSDTLREQIERLGLAVMDTLHGSILKKR